MKDVQDIDSDK